MNLSQSALSKLWQQQMKPVQQYSHQSAKELIGKDVDQGSGALSFDAFSRTLCADYSSSRILDMWKMYQGSIGSISLEASIAVPSSRFQHAANSEPLGGNRPFLRPIPMVIFGLACFCLSCFHIFQDEFDFSD